ncbi:hypothetical protein BDV97DRAFT_367750 [Delphinella strobiligena]|nr:hypothetical protein BDV97DRAFT_367750 [Delphinella strobiligena]
MAADETPGNTTIGVELEFILICPLDKMRAFQKANQLRVREAPVKMIHEALKMNAPEIPLIPFRTQQQRNMALLDGNEARDSRARYSRWDVITDGSVTLLPDESTIPGTAGYGNYDIEIRSRIMDFNKPTPCMGAPALEWRHEIERVVNVLNATFNSPENPGYRLLVNSTCGMHVHVGGQRDWPHVARGVMGLYTAFERQLDKLFNTSRISGWSVNAMYGDEWDPVPIEVVDPGRRYNYPGSDEPLNETYSDYCKGLSRVHISNASRTLNLRRLPHTVVRSPGSSLPFQVRMAESASTFYAAQTQLHVPAWLYTVFSIRSIKELQDIWKCFGERITQHECMVNFENLGTTPNEPDKKWTIEFRGHPGTLDVDEICHWVETCGTMIETCAGITTENLADYLIANWADTDFTFLDLLEHTIVKPETLAFYTDMLNTVGPEDYASRKHRRVDEHEKLYPDDMNHEGLKDLVRFVERKQFHAKHHVHVEAKIQRKLYAGLYGRFPQQAVANMLPRDVYVQEGHKLRISEAVVDQYLNGLVDLSNSP